MSEAIQEYVSSSGERLRLDQHGGVLRGVKLLGMTSSNGRRYTESALRSAIGLYEGAKVNVNHPHGDPLSPRDYRDRIGVVRSVELRPGDGLYGNLCFNPKHALSEQLAWDAEHAPHSVGLSHNVIAKTRRDGAGTVVESIVRVQSVDLVADPATTSGLFEQESPPATELTPFDALTLDVLMLHRPDLVDEVVAAQAQLREDRRERDGAARRTRERLVRASLGDAGLPLPGSDTPGASQITSDAFLEALFSATDDEQVRRLAADRGAAVRAGALWARSGRGVGAAVECREQRPWGASRRAAATVEEFVAAVAVRS